MKGGPRGVVVGVTALAVLETFLSYADSKRSDRVVGVLGAPAAVLRWLIDPTVPAIPQHLNSATRARVDQVAGIAGSLQHGAGSSSTHVNHTQGGGTGTASLGPLPGLAPGITPSSALPAPPSVPLPVIAPPR